jgi:hypothetical protein
MLRTRPHPLPNVKELVRLDAFVNEEDTGQHNVPVVPDGICQHPGSLPGTLRGGGESHKVARANPEKVVVAWHRAVIKVKKSLENIFL